MILFNTYNKSVILSLDVCCVIVYYAGNFFLTILRPINGCDFQNKSLSISMQFSYSTMSYAGNFDLNRFAANNIPIDEPELNKNCRFNVRQCNAERCWCVNKRSGKVKGKGFNFPVSENYHCIGE